MSYIPPVFKIWVEVEKTHSWKFIYQLFHRFFYCYKKMYVNKKNIIGLYILI